MVARIGEYVAVALPKDIDARVRAALEALRTDCDELLVKVRAFEVLDAMPGRIVDVYDANDDLMRPSQPAPVPSIPWPREEFVQLQNDALTVFRYIGATSEIGRVEPLKATSAGAETLSGIAKSVERNYARGFYEPLFARIDAALAGDFLAQAAELLEEGEVGKSDQVPAAVLLGAVFERRVRRLCESRTPPVETTSNGHPKKLNALIDDLKKAGLYIEMKAKELRWIASIRNQAAHGDFESFTREDVVKMQTAVGQFLESFPA